MNNYLKYFIILLNLLILIIGFKWFNQDKASAEPIIVIITQVIGLITLILEKKLSNTFIKKVNNSIIDLKNTESTHIEDIKDSKIKIK